jgi:hypothetical protein
MLDAHLKKILFLYYLGQLYDISAVIDNNS